MIKKTIGILGDGQLARMLVQSSQDLGFETSVLGESVDTPAKQILNDKHCYNGSYQDIDAVIAFSKNCNFLTIEIEHVNATALEVLEKSNPQISVNPSSRTMKLIQDKFLQKEHLKSLGLPVPHYEEATSRDFLENFSKQNSFPFIIKSKLNSYDGYGNTTINNMEDIQNFCSKNKTTTDFYIEEFVKFEKEVSVVCVKGIEETKFYPIVETVQRNDRCEMVFAPAFIDEKASTNIQLICSKIIQSFEGLGIFAIEMFVLKDNVVLVNEIAPRVHNSGHITTESCYTSQFENHLRAITHMPLGNTDMKVQNACMINLLGNDTMSLEEYEDHAHKLVQISNTRLHLYKKSNNKKGRKMGHVTIIDPDFKSLANKASLVFEHLYKGEVPDFIKLKIKSLLSLPEVSIIMGSDSDLKVMKNACMVLEEFGISYEVLIISAHRTPLEMIAFGDSTKYKQTKVIISGAGGAAHLPGMVASLTSIPVIGVPVNCTPLNGKDALYSIVQMPKGVPVATVGINNAENAGLLAARIVGTSNKNITARMDLYRHRMEQTVKDKAQTLGKVGWKEYMNKKKD